MEKLFVFDIETTGVKHWRNGVHQISGMIIIDGDIKESFDFKVQPNPKCTIEDEALEISGVTKEQILQYPKMESIYTEIISIKTQLGIPLYALENDTFDTNSQL